MIFQHFLLEVDMAIAEVNAHVFGCEETKEVMLIDAGKFDPAIEHFVSSNDLKLTTIFITHDHGDHVAGVEECARHFGAQVIAGTEAPGGYPADRVVGHGDTIQIGLFAGKIVSTPGHTPVALSLVFPGMVFSGDALFAGSVGGTASQENYDLQHGHVREQLLSLPGDYQVHSGHGPATTIEIERRYNPFFS